MIVLRQSTPTLHQSGDNLKALAPLHATHGCSYGWDNFFKKDEFVDFAVNTEVKWRVRLMRSSSPREGLPWEPLMHSSVGH